MFTLLFPELSTLTQAAGILNFYSFHWCLLCIINSAAQIILRRLYFAIKMGIIWIIARNICDKPLAN